MNRSWIMGLGLVLAGPAGGAGEWVGIPAHETRAGPAGGFEMGRCEVTVGEFMEYLEQGEVREFPETEQIERRRDGRLRARRGTRRQAVAEVTVEEAEAYCRWLSRRTGCRVRLPTGAEWEVAARGGLDGAPYPWGWGADPRKMARFDAPGPAARVGSYAPNGFGLRDMAGNLYEWCAAEPGEPAGQRMARGGGWPERDRSLLKVDGRMPFPAAYRGRDVGFRLLRERERQR